MAELYRQAKYSLEKLDKIIRELAMGVGNIRQRFDDIALPADGLHADDFPEYEQEKIRYVLDTISSRWSASTEDLVRATTSIISLQINLCLYLECPGFFGGDDDDGGTK